MKWLKDKRIEYYKTDYIQDKSGGQHARYERMGTLWAYISGTNYDAQFANGAVWDKPTFNVVFSRPPYDIALADHLAFDGKGYKIISINELSGRVGLDVRVLVELDPHWTVPSEP